MLRIAVFVNAARMKLLHRGALVDQVANMRVPMFVLTGGDPLKRPDLQAIVQYARRRSVKTSLTPSATPLFTFARDSSTPEQSSSLPVHE